MAGPVTFRRLGWHTYFTASLPVRLGVIPDQPFSDTGRFVEVFVLDRHHTCDLNAVLHLFERPRRDAGADARAGRDRGHEPDAVQAVVDRHAQAGELDGLADERADE